MSSGVEKRIADMYEQRIAICRKCDDRRDLPAGIVQCKNCGCIMTVKARFPQMKCPIGKW